MTPIDTHASVVVFGGRSEIGVEVAVRLAAGRVVVLAARRPGALGEETARLRAAGATEVHVVDFDAEATDSHQELIETMAAEHGRIGVAIVAFGILGDQAKAQADVSHALQIARIDYLAQISVLTILANVLRAQRSGTIIAFSSVAGVRVRKANYVYGSTKAGLDGFCLGLSDALHGSGVHLLLARPGFVIGNMTAQMLATGTKPAPFASTAPQVADAVISALHRGKAVVWIPAVLRPVFFGMRLLPQWAWRRLPR